MDKAQPADFWATGGFTSYAQLACTVIALLAGLLAYSSWKQQERAKRYYELAATILQDANAQIDCIVEARMGFYLFGGSPPTMDFAKKVAVEGAEKLKLCAAHYGTLRTHVVIARNVFNVQVAENLSWLQAQHDIVKWAHDSLTSATRSQQAWERDGEQARLKKRLLDAGVQGESVQGAGNEDKDELRSRLYLIRNNLDTLLARYLRYE